MFGTKENMYTDKIFDLVLLLAKQFIYSCKWANTLPTLENFKYLLKNRYVLERYRHMSIEQLHRFNVMWFPYKDLIN